MIVESEKVKVCPLCADKSFLHVDRSNLTPLYWIKCNNLQCGCTLNPDKDRQVVLDRWNKRW